MRIDDACEEGEVLNVEQTIDETELDRWENEGGSIPPNELNAGYLRRNLAGTFATSPLSWANPAIRVVDSVQDRGHDEIPGAYRSPSLTQVKERVRVSESEMRRIRVPVSRIHVAGDEVIVDDEQFSLEEEGLRSLCSEIGAPYGYLGQLDRELRNRNLEFGLKATGRREGGITDENSLILVRNGCFRSLGRADLFSLPGPQVLDASARRSWSGTGCKFPSRRTSR